MDEPSPRSRTLYLDARKTTANADGRALRIKRAHQSDVLVPLQRIDRMVVEGCKPGLIDACIAVVRNGGMVHFLTPGGEAVAVLQAARPESKVGPKRLAALVRARESAHPIHWWEDAQWRHAWSLVFRRSPAGHLLEARDRFRNYMEVRKVIGFDPHEWERLDGKVLAWTQAEFGRMGLYPILAAVAEHERNLINILVDCLSLTTAWAYVCWRRERSGVISDLDITRFFEWRALAHIPKQFQRHMSAFSSQYGVPWGDVLTGGGVLTWASDDYEP